MPYSQIISRAFEIVRRHRALWVFGFLVALTGGAGGNYGSGANFSGPETDFNGGTIPGFDFNPAAVFGLILIAGLVILALVIISTIVRYVSEVALIDGAARADDGETLTVRAGFRRGWSRDALYLFLNQLILSLPIIVAVIGAVVVAFVFLFGGFGVAQVSGRDGLALVGVAAFLLLLIPLIGIVLLLSIVISLLSQWSSREVVLRGLGPIEAIGEAWRLARSYLKETILFGLLMWAISLGFGLLMMPVLLVAGAVVVGPVFLAYQATRELLPTLLVGVPLGLLVLVGFSIIAGLYTAFSSTAWTLAWRHLRGLSPSPAAGLEITPDEGDTSVLAPA